MASSGDIQTIIMQAAIQAAAAVVRTIWKADPPTKPYTRKSRPEEPHRPRQAGPMLSQCWKLPDRYVDLFNFEMEAANALPSKV